MSEEEGWKAFFASGVAAGWGIGLVVKMIFGFPDLENLVTGAVGLCACLWAWKVFSESIDRQNYK